MPAFLVELPVSGGKTLIGAANSLVVFAEDAANARAAAAAHFDGDSDALWNSAQTIVTQIAAGTDLSGFSLEVAVQDSTNPFRVRSSGGAGNVAVASGAVNAGGTGYIVDDILTVVGGTFTRAATFRVITVSTGVITAVEMVDPGQYTVAPSLVANAVTGGAGASATLDLTMAVANSYEVLMGQMVTLLNAQTDVAGAAVDFSSGASGIRALTVAAVADNIGDKQIEVRFLKNGTSVPGLVGTITDGGVAGAALTAGIPATIVLPNVVRALKS